MRNKRELIKSTLTIDLSWYKHNKNFRTGNHFVQRILLPWRTQYGDYIKTNNFIPCRYFRIVKIDYFNVLYNKYYVQQKKIEKEIKVIGKIITTGLK